MRWVLIAAIGLAGSAGYLTSVALGVGAQAPTKTVTIDVGTGAQGQPGPPGPPGDKGDPGSPGAESCPTGSTFGKVIFNAPGGHTDAILTCIVD